ncbi:(Fe-S)-binding protein [Alkalibaculum bacchi]|uniref:(Fe-S)-binding protein n=1 Tax=Alkalibaculum bacchi TaxID=645887 RepID=UPI0026EAE4A7|nr:(Fe-S)-binding protein [Alkalibaculum bacchi]
MNGVKSMYLEEVNVIFIEPCTADANKMRFKAAFSRNISEILPYLNAEIKIAQYNHRTENLTFNQGIKIITLSSETLSVSKIINETDAYEMCDYIKNLINDIYKKRDVIVPLFEMRKKPSVLDIYKYLPKTNCKRCGESTCVAFASKLIVGELQVQQCRSIHENKHDGKLDELKKILNC